MSVNEQLGVRVPSGSSELYYRYVAGLSDVQQERDLFAQLVTDQIHFKACELAEGFVANIITSGSAQGIIPLLKAIRSEGQALEIDTEDYFNQSFLSSLGCESESDLYNHFAATLGFGALRLEEVSWSGELTQQELNRLDQVPLPALRLVFDPDEI